MECDSQQQQQQQHQQATKNTEEAKFDTQIKQDIYHSDQQHHQPDQQGDRSDLGPVEKRMKASDFAEYDELINELADQLKLARHPDSLVVLKAARLLLEANSNELPPPSASLMDDDNSTNRAAQPLFSQENDDRETRASGCLNKDGSSRLGDDRIRTIQQSKFTLDDVLLPKTLVTKSATKTSDSERDVNKKYDLTNTFECAAKALKLLYLDDQRQLQNQVNELISSIQSITANPRTDPRLLATGR